MATIEQKRAQQRERAILRIMSTCVHFTGIQHNACKAGINYHEQFGTGTGCFAKIPCIHEGEIGIKECLQVKYPNRDEAEVEELSREAHSKRFMQALYAAHADSKAKGYGKGHGGQDSLKCPCVQRERFVIQSPRSTVICTLPAQRRVAFLGWNSRACLYGAERMKGKWNSQRWVRCSLFAVRWHRRF